MNLKEWAEKTGLTIKEAKSQTGLTHWNSTVPESCDEIPEVAESADISEKVVTVVEAEPVHEDQDVDLDLIRRSIHGAGTKSPYWNKRHLIGR
jgi:hypothetical protein